MKNEGSNNEKQYVVIDLKSFYASVECVERGLDPLDTNLVVADISRTEKTICLAVTPTLKAYGISGRARLFEVIEKVSEVNSIRRQKLKNRCFKGKSVYRHELERDSGLELDYMTVSPRMALYMKYSTEIYGIYLKYVAPEDIHVYSIDEVFIDVTGYIAARKISATEFASMMIKDIFSKTGITATAGIGTNLYLCKVAMDILAKHAQPDENGVRMASLDEMSYRRLLWDHRPLTDFWRIGRGYAERLEEKGLYTMGDIAKCSVGSSYESRNEELLYRMFGINAELLIDHAWGYEPCTIGQIKSYRPRAKSLSSGQVLKTPYPWEKARLVLKEMADMLALELVEKRVVCEKIVITIGYDRENLRRKDISELYYGEVSIDHYGRAVPKHAHGTIPLEVRTSSSRLITKASLELFDRITNKDLLVRRLNISAEGVVPEEKGEFIKEEQFQFDLFSSPLQQEIEFRRKKEILEKEKRIQQAMLEIKKRYGKNAVLKGMNFENGATAAERNSQIGGHKA